MSYKEQSRLNWGRQNNSTDLTISEISTGAILRIADAIELMAKRHTELINERDMYQRFFENGKQSRKTLEHRLSSTKGQVTKMKKKIAKLKELA